MTQYMYPTPPTSSNSGWNGFPSISLTDNINDSATAAADDDAGYINTASLTNGVVDVDFFLNNPATDPNIDTEHRFVCRLKSWSSGTFENTRASLFVDIYRSSTLLFSVFIRSVGGSPRYSFSGVEVGYGTYTSNISSGLIARLGGDYTNLRAVLRLAQDGSTDGSAVVRVTQLYFAVPDVVITPPYVFDHIMEGGLKVEGDTAVSDVTGAYVIETSGGLIYGGTAEVVADLAFKQVFDTHYGLTIENPARDTLAIVSTHTSAPWTREANKFSTLTVTLPTSGNESLIPLADFPNLFVIKDKNGRVLDRLAIAKVQENAGETSTLSIQAYGLLWMLSKTNIPFYSSNGGSSVFLIVKFLLETYQVTDSPHPITLGQIDSDIGNQLKEITFQNLSITEALLNLYKTAGGTIEVDGNGILSWYGSNYNQSPNSRISDKTNLISMTRNEHNDMVRTKITIQSQDETGTPITATAQLPTGAAEDPDILAKYGIVPEFIYDNAIKTFDNAQELADSWLERLKTLPVDLIADVIDRSKSDLAEEPQVPFEPYALNMTTRLIHPRLGDLGPKLIVKIEVDLTAPSKNKLDFIDPVSTDFRRAGRESDMLANLSGNTQNIKNIGISQNAE